MNPQYGIIAPTGGFGNHIRHICLLSKEFNLDLDKSKLDFFLEDIYPSNRNWQNWLNFDYKYKNTLSQYINLQHHSRTDISKTVFVNTNPELCLHHYIKLNSQLNGLSINDHLYNLNKDTEFTKTFNYFEVDGDQFWNSTLPQNEYNKLITFFGISNNYTEAQIIHTRWYELHKSSEKDIGNWYLNFYNTSNSY